MKKFIIYLFSFILLCGCVKKLQQFKNKNDISPVEVVSFDKVDIDNSGEISKQEFKNIQEKSNVNYVDPMWGFYGVLGMVAVLLTLSNFIQSRKNKEDVRN